MSPSAVIAVIGPGSIGIPCARTLMAALSSGYGVAVHSASPYLDIERNTVVRDFLASDFQWLIFLDSDMSVDVDTLEHLCDNPEEPVVSGIYGTGTGEGFATVCYEIRDGRHVNLLPDELYARPRVGDRIEVDSVGAGCLALHRSILEHMEANPLDVREGICPWFIESTWKGLVLGEDHGLCERLRRMGVPILVDPRVRASHFKTIEITIPQEPPR